jgi:hypothetical protein
MNITIETIQAIIEKHESYLDDYAREYGEPGYDKPGEWILFANWNPVPRRTQSWLESHGYALEWSDEWTVNWDGDQKAYRTSPDGHGWRSQLVYLDDGQMIAKGELTPNSTALDDYIAHLVDHPERVDQFELDWTQHGFERLVADGAYESGLHPGQNDDPKKLMAHWREVRPGYEFLFTLDDVGQFDISFSIWGRKKEQE